MKVDNLLNQDIDIDIKSYCKLYQSIDKQSLSKLFLQIKIN